jgi:hypothetical protein
MRGYYSKRSMLTQGDLEVATRGLPHQDINNNISQAGHLVDAITMEHWISLCRASMI